MSLSARLSARFDPEARWIALALGLLLLALLMPRLELPRRTYHAVVVFDISQSMGVEDYELDGEPVSRLDYARAAARRALRELPCGSRIGWGAFTEYRTLLLLAPVEVCANYSDLVASLDNVDGRMRWGNSSEVMKGVFWAMRAAKETREEPGVLFVTDGQEAPPLDPEQPPEMFSDLVPGEVPGIFLGAGADVPRRIPRIDEDGRRVGYWRPWEVLHRYGTTAIDAQGRPREHLSVLHEKHLRAVAQQVGFGYARLARLDDLGDAVRDRRFARTVRAPTDLALVPALLALGVLAFRLAPAWLPALLTASGRRARRDP